MPRGTSRRVNRAAALQHTRRGCQQSARRKGVIDQTWMSSQEGPDDSPKAQTASKAWKARKA